MAYILVIEDEPTVAMVLKEALSDEGHTVLTASDGKSGLERLRGRPTPDLLLVDLFMPGIGGRMVVAAMRADSDLRNVPVIIITGAVPRPADFPAAGTYQAVISKPFDLDAVVETVHRLLPQERPPEISRPQ